jgi:hypothetical protein
VGILDRRYTSVSVENDLIFMGTEYTDGDGIYIYNLDDQKLVKLLSPDQRWSFNWNPYLSGRLVVRDEKFDKLCDINLEGTVFHQYPYEAGTLQFLSPRGDRVAYINEKHQA